MKCLSYLVKHPAGWFLMVTILSTGNSSSTKATSQSGENLFRTATCMNTKVRPFEKPVSKVLKIVVLNSWMMMIIIIIK